MADNNAVGRAVIWTDNENTRSLIWHNYWGFVDNFDNYMMYKQRFGREHPVYMAGVFRYAVSFFEEVRPFLDKFQKISYSDVVERIIYGNSLFELDNLLKVRRFCSDFMFYSGIKNVVFTKDERDGIERVKDDYNV